MLGSRRWRCWRPRPGRIAYDERGEGDPIVLLSSGAHDRHDFDELRDLLPARFRSIAPDWPAHGESPPGSAPASAMRFADVAEEFVEALAPGGAVVVGNSVGGFAAGRLAIRRPDLVKGLVLVDSGGFGGRPPQVRAFCALMARPGFLRRIYPSFRQPLHAPAERRRPPRPRRRHRHHPRGPGPEGGRRALAQLRLARARPARRARPRSRLPTLVVWGKRDPVIPLKLGRRAAASIPGAELVVLDTGHSPQVSDPEGFAAHLDPVRRRRLGGAG